MADYIKIVVAGDGGVGKTTFLNTLIKDNYNEATPLTVGIDIYIKDIKVENKDFPLQIWDLGGQERFKSLHERCSAYIQGIKGGIFMFDLTRITSLENIGFWIELFRRQDDNIPILLVGSKYDLIDKNSIDKELILSLKQEYNLLDYLEISSKIKHNIDNVFEILVKAIMSNNLI